VFVPAFVLFSEKDFRRGSELTRLPPSSASKRFDRADWRTAKTHKGPPAGHARSLRLGVPGGCQDANRTAYRRARFSLLAAGVGFGAIKRPFWTFDFRTAAAVLKPATATGPPPRPVGVRLGFPPRTRGGRRKYKPRTRSFQGVLAAEETSES
jgi:hypothetical protein